MLQIFMFKRNAMNNGILDTNNAMPQKDLTSDGTASFATGRTAYVETTKAYNSMTPTINIQKKWYGNRDASSVTAKRHNRSIGKGSMNDANVPLSFTTSVDTNTARQALTRTRGGGSVVPPKCVNTPGLSGGVPCHVSSPVKGLKPNENTNYMHTLMMKRANLGCNVPYDCLNKQPFCKTQC